MAAVKICIIGAGSAVFSINFVRDLCLAPGLKGSTVTLMDIDENRLNATHNISVRYARETNADLKFEMSTNRKSALQHSDFVLNTALVGGHDQQEIERRLAMKHGYPFRSQVGLGNYHQLRFFLDVARDIEEICPDAWLLLVANPVQMGSTLLTRQTKVKVVGYCDGPPGGFREIAQVLGLDYEDVRIQAPGINHCIWMTDFHHRGDNAYPILDEWIEKKAGEYWKSMSPTGNPFRQAMMAPINVELYRIFGLWPVGDTSRRPWWCHTDFATSQRYYGPIGGPDSEPGWRWYLNRLQQRVDRVAEVASDPSIAVTKEYPAVHSDEENVNIIDAIANDKEGKYQLNIPNNGALPGIPDDVVVEIPTIIGGRGYQGVQCRLPRIIISYIMRDVELQEMIMEALRTGNKMILLDVLLENPHTKSIEQARATLDDLLSLPHNKDLAQHFR